MSSLQRERKGLKGHAGAGVVSCHLAFLACVLMPVSLCGFGPALGLELPEVACELLRVCCSGVKVCSSRCPRGKACGPRAGRRWQLLRLLPVQQ